MTPCKAKACQFITVELEEGKISSKSCMARVHHVLKTILKVWGIVLW